MANIFRKFLLAMCIVCVLSSTLVEGKPIYDIFFGRPDNDLERYPPPPKLGGKERFNEICRVQSGINRCWR